MGSLENPFLGRRGVTKNKYTGGDYPKKGAWSVCRFKGGKLGKKEGNALYIDY